MTSLMDKDAVRSIRHEHRHKHRLRYKSHKRSRDRSASPTRARSHNAVERLDSDDEAFYGGPMASKGILRDIDDDDENSFRERLFDAMADDEGADYWARVYSQPIHDFTRPSDEMTDEQYAAYVRHGMWQRRYGATFTSPPSSRSRSGREYAHRERIVENPHSDDLNAQLLKRWDAYLASFEQAGRWSLVNLPWPTARSSATSLNKDSIMSFFTAAGDPRTIAKQELRRRWHPDKFSQLYGSKLVEGEREAIMGKVTLVAQVLNEIISE